LDAGGLVGVNGGKGAEEEAVNVGKNGFAAGGDVVGSQELVEISESGIDALGGLELLVIGEERSLEIENVGFPKLLGVGETKEVVWASTGSLQRRPEGVRCWQRMESLTELVLAEGAFMFLSNGRVRVYPSPVFFCKSGKQRTYG
jgi:hypothetical protein